MEQKFNSFDNQIKDAYEGHELPYDRSSWDNLSSKLDAMAPAPVTYFTALTTGLVAVGVIFLSLLFVLSGNNQTPDLTADNATPTEISKTADKTEAQSAPKSSSPAPADTSISEAPEEEAADETGEPAADEASEKSENADTAVENPTSYTSAPVAEADVEVPVENRKSKKSETSVAATKVDKSGKKPAPKPTEKPAVITGDKTITSTESSNNKTVRTSCTGITINFDASQDYGRDAKYLWNFGDGFFSNESNPSHTFNKPGTFDVSLSVTSHTTGQITSNVVQAMIEVIEAPRARMSVHIPSPSEIEVENISIGDDSAEWMIDSEAVSAGAVAVLPFAPGAQNEIKLVALNKSGCADTLTKHLNFKEIADALAVDADAETPFFPEAAPGVTFSKLYIFDAASGEKVFHSADGEGWNPTEMKSGAEYIFLAVAKEKDRTEVYRGTVVRK